MTDASEILRRLEATCGPAGLDLLYPFSCDWYRPRRESEALNAFGKPDRLGVLVGNTKHLWPLLVRAFDEAPELAATEHPLDAHVERALCKSLEQVGVAASVIWSHHTRPAFPIQFLAESVGFAAVAPMHLTVHPQYGPWLSLRAVVVFETRAALGSPPKLERPCDNCAAPCVEAFQDALAATRAVAPLDQASIARRWQQWVELRDVCPVGRTWRFCDSQVEYHYTKRRALLTQRR